MILDVSAPCLSDIEEVSLCVASGTAAYTGILAILAQHGIIATAPNIIQYR